VFQTQYRAVGFPISHIAGRRVAACFVSCDAWEGNVQLMSDQPWTDAQALEAVKMFPFLGMVHM
jgi:hypothetical protein